MLSQPGEADDDGQPYRIAERSQNGCELQLLAIRVNKLSRGPASHATSIRGCTGFPNICYVREL